jgi:hypothetical protein
MFTFPKSENQYALSLERQEEKGENYCFKSKNKHIPLLANPMSPCLSLKINLIRYQHKLDQFRFGSLDRKQIKVLQLHL